MPLYDYKCEKCEYLFEVEQRITEDLLTSCPKCKGKIRRLISPVGIIFKGSGFHVTDYNSSKKPHSTTVPNKEAKKETKTETKQEGKKNPPSQTS